MFHFGTGVAARHLFGVKKNQAMPTKQDLERLRGSFQNFR